MKRDGSPLGIARCAEFAFRRGCALVALIPSLFVVAAFAGAEGRGADGRFEERTSSHFVLFQDVDIDETGGFRGSRRFEKQVLDELELAYDRLDSNLGLRPPRRIEVWVYDPVIFDRQFGGRFRFVAAGFYNGAIHIRGSTQMTVGLGRVLHHELVHAAFQAAAPSLVLPAWLNEGVAEWFEARALSKRQLSVGERNVLRQASRKGEWLSLATLSGSTFAGLGPQNASLAYLQSYGMVTFLVQRFGERKLGTFIERAVRSGDVGRALDRTYGMDATGVGAAFRADLQ